MLVVGPPTEMVGGIASVAAQMRRLDFAGRYRLESLANTVSPVESETLFRRVLRHLGQLRMLIATIRRTRARIVHVHTCSGFSLYRSALDMVVAQLLGCRVILHVHGAAFDKFHAGAGRLLRPVIAWSLARADRVIALSGGWARKLRRMSPRARVVVIENAVESPSVTPTRHHSSACRFLLLARMDEWKGVDDLLEACAVLASEGTRFELVLAGPPGTAGDEAVLEEKIRRRGLAECVRYVGPVRGERKTELLGWAEVYVQPSHHEGMPLSMLEALAHGLPVVATKVGAVPEVIEDHKCGLLVSPHEPAELARAMGAVVADRKLLTALSREALALSAKRFSTHRFRDDLLSLYDGMRTRGRGRPSGDAPPASGRASIPRVVLGRIIRAG